jgi:MFS family permease
VGESTSISTRSGSIQEERVLAQGNPIVAEESATAHRANGSAKPQAEEPGAVVHDARTRKLITAALLLVMVLVSMEMTITSTAMPTIIGDLHGLEHYSWVASIYLLACTVTMPLYGRLADALGRKRVVMAAIVIFCGGSLLASTSHTMTHLIICRGIQGLGAGGVMPVVLTIIGDIFTLEERAKIQGFFSGVWGTSSLAGPALGALLVKTLGWRSVFWVNLPLGTIGLIMLAWNYHEKRERHEMDLDAPGVASLAIASMALLSLVSRLGPAGWSWTMIAVLTVVTLAALIYFVRHERRADHPILSMSLLANRAVGPAVFGSALFGIGFLSLDTYVPLYVQGGRGGDATAAASVVTPVMLTWALSGIVAAPLLVRWGFRRTATLGATLIIAGFTGLLACALAGAPHWMLTAALSITGIGFGPVSMAFLISAQEAVAYQQRGGVTSAISFFRTMGGAVGIGVLGALFNVLTASQTNHLRALGVKPAELLDPRTHAKLPADVLAYAQHMIAGGLMWVFAAMVGCSVVLWVVTRLLPKSRCEHEVSAREAMEVI